mmetsp:Transcript_1886/g.11353  ORF Transcript_1886/g.11353 Transcript_1886/m.11353 type:complete len:534 (+) Transcript_1886:209-1810(+)
MSIRNAGTLLCLCFFALQCTCSRPPNVLLVVADDLGYGDVAFTPVESGEELDTPFLNQLAETGVVLDQLYGGPQCTPSRSSLLTGKYPSTIGMQHKVATLRLRYALPLKEKTIGEHLQELGYSTHLVGKWHLGSPSWENTPTYRGFDTFYGYHGGAQNYYTHMAGPSHLRGLDFWNGTTPDHGARGTYSTWLFGNETCRIIEGSAAEPERPWFIMLSYQAVHGPMQAPPQYIKNYKGRGLTTEREIFGGMTTAMDDSLRGVFEALETSGQKDQTLVVFLSDNGGPVEGHSTNFPLRGGKHTLWEGGVRLAGFMHGSMIHNAGKHFQGLMHIADLLPTIADAAGGKGKGAEEAANEIDGISQWQAIVNGKQSKRTEVLLNYDPVTNDNWWGGYAGIRVGDLKLLAGDPGQPSGWCKPVVHNCRPTPELPRIQSCCRDMRVPSNPHSGYRLFNLTLDPTERVDLALRYPELVEKLRERLQYYIDNAAEPLNGTPEQRQIDPRSNPNRFGGVWTPWLEHGNASSLYIRTAKFQVTD